MEQRNAPGDLRAAFDPLMAFADTTPLAPPVSLPVPETTPQAPTAEGVRLDLDPQLNWDFDAIGVSPFAPILVAAQSPGSAIDLESAFTNPAFQPWSAAPQTSANRHVGIADEDGQIPIVYDPYPVPPYPSVPPPSDPQPPSPPTPPSDPEPPIETPPDVPDAPSKPTPPDDTDPVLIDDTNETPIDDPNLTDDPIVVDEDSYDGVWTIGDRVWRDTNRDGIQSEGERGIYNIRVELHYANGSLAAATRTDEVGQYHFRFAGRGGDRFYIQVEMGDYLSTYQHAQGSTERNDSDINSTGRTRVFGLASTDNYEPDYPQSSSSTAEWIITTLDAGINPKPEVALSVLSEVPINANNDNGSAWKSATQKYIPTTRDFNVKGPTAYQDTQLKAATLTIQNPIPGKLKVTLKPKAGAKVKVGLFADQMKNPLPASVVVTAPANLGAFAFTFYVEGIHESESLKDTFSYEGVYAYATTSVHILQSGLVTPVMRSLQVDIPTQSVSFFRTKPVASGIDGIVAADMRNPQNRLNGITITSDVIVGGDIKRAGYVQNEERIDDGINVNDGRKYAATTVNPAGAYRHSYTQAAVAAKVKFPLLDGKPGGELTTWPIYEESTQNGNQYTMVDSPNIDLNNGGGLFVNLYDYRLQFMVYFVVQFQDGSIYTIATQRWFVNIYADNWVNGLGATRIRSESGVRYGKDWDTAKGSPGGPAGNRSNDAPLTTVGLVVKEAVELANVP